MVSAPSALPALASSAASAAAAKTKAIAKLDMKWPPQQGGCPLKNWKQKVKLLELGSLDSRGQHSCLCWNCVNQNLSRGRLP